MNRIQKFLQRIVGVQPKQPIQSISTPKVSITPPATVRAASNLDEMPGMTMMAQMNHYKSWIYSSTFRNAAEIANMQLRLFKKVKDGTEEVKQHEMLDLLDEVNSYQTRYDLFEWLGILWGLTGECYWWKQRDSSGKIMSLYAWFNPAYIDVVPSSEEFIKGYVYNVPGTNTKIPFDAKDMIQFKLTDPVNPYRGKSPLKAAEMEAGTDDRSGKFNFNFFRNSARPRGAFKTEGTLSSDQFERIQAQIEANYGVEAENEWKPLILEGGLEWQEIGMSRQDMDFLEQRKFSRDHIYTLYGIPPALMFPESSNRAVSETAKIIYLENTIKPYFRKIVSILNEYLLAQEGYDDLFFDFVDPSPEKEAEKYNAYKVALDAGWVSRNEVRAWENLAPVDGGDGIYVPFNYVQVGESELVKLKENFNFKRLRRTNKEKVDQIIAETTKEQLEKLTWDKERINKKARPKKKLKSATHKFDEKFKEAHWKQLVQYMDLEENQFKNRLISYFEKQENRVLATVGKKEVKQIKFDLNLEKETKALIILFEPYIRNLIAVHGEEAFNMLGIDPTTFVSTSVNVNKFINNEGLKWAKEINKTTKSKIKQQILLGEKQGEGIVKIRKRIKGVFEEATTSRANNIARTETSRADNFGIVEGYKQSGVVTAKEWVTAADERVCPYCGPMHGRIVSLDKNFFNQNASYRGTASNSISFSYGSIGEPPLHAQCRCTTIPVVKSIR